MTVMVVIAAVFGVAAFAACGNSNEVTVIFVTYDEQTIPVTGEKGAEVDFPEVTREGYVFDGWYADAGYSGTPVTSAVFEEDTTYYAKWAQGYAVTFELDGGTLPAGLSATLYLKEGDVISTAVAAYIPTKTDLVFDGWLMNGKELSSTAKMPAEAVVLTAKYSAQYTVNVYLQDADLEKYTLSQDLSTTGYAVVGEEFAPEINVEGYTL